MSRARRGGEAFAARVIATYGRSSMLEDDRGAIWSAVRRGRRGDVVVGDRVNATVVADGQAAIESIAARTSLLYRADMFRTKELAANIDQVLVIFASRPGFNLWFIWKALLAARAAGIDAIVVRNKSDLAEGAATAGAVLNDLQGLGWPTASISARADTQHAIKTLDPIVRGRSSLLVGQSGMGKSTLLNLLVPDALARTREYSERLNLGKQTTTAARWYDLRGGGAIVDTPGFQEFGLEHLTLEDVVAGLPEFAPHLGQCRFLDCRHLAEPACAIRRAVESGAIAPARYDFYRALAETRKR